MDRWVGGSKTAEEEQLEEAERQERRDCDDEEVICDEIDFVGP